MESESEEPGNSKIQPKKKHQKARMSLVNAIRDGKMDDLPDMPVLFDVLFDIVSILLRIFQVFANVC